MGGLYMPAIWKKAVTVWWQLFSWNKEAADEVRCWGLVRFLEQSKLIREGCSKQEDLFKMGVGAKQACLGRLLQAGKAV